MAATAYTESYSTLADREKTTGVRYQAALEISQGIDRSSDTANLAAGNVSNFIDILRDTKEANLLQAVFDVLWKLSQLKGFKTEFTEGGFPAFCADYVKDDRFRLKSSYMVLSLLRESNMTSEMVDVGMVELLLRYSDSFDRSMFGTKPHFLLKTRKFVFLSLKQISDDPAFVDHLIEADVLNHVKKNCFNLHVAEELARVLDVNSSRNILKEIHTDELSLHQAGMDILFNLCRKFENYGRKNPVPRREEVKYVYDYDSEQEASEEISFEKLKMIAPKDAESPDFGEGSPMRLLLDQIKNNNLLDDMIEATVQDNQEIGISGLRNLYRLSSVLHTFVDVDKRVVMVKNLLAVANRMSGQRRHTCFSCLLVLAHYPENCPVFLSTSVFQQLFFLGMEESGEVLNQLVKILGALAMHRSTAEEMVLRSEIPRLLVKVLHDDFKGKVDFEVPAVSDTFTKSQQTEKLMEAIEKTPGSVLGCIYHLALNSADCCASLVQAGAKTVLNKILLQHPEDLVGMTAVMTLSLLKLPSEQNFGFNACKKLVDMILDAFECTLKGESYSGLVFCSRELTLCLKLLSEDSKNQAFVGRGLPLFVKAIKIFVDDFGVKKEETVSVRSLGHIASCLQNLTRSKVFLSKLIELGPALTNLLEEAEEYVAEEVVDFSAVDPGSSVVSTIHFLQQLLIDEAEVYEARQEVNDHLRKSSRIQLSRLLRQASELEVFANSGRYSFRL